jgi:hypothetical protein
VRWMLAAALGLSTLTVHAVLAEQGTNWNGPPCRIGAASFKVCSQEPPAPLDPAPCYVSHFANYTPDRIELALIALCQAAKAALVAGSTTSMTAVPLSQVGPSLLAVKAKAQELLAVIQNDPEDASKHRGKIRSVGRDILDFGNGLSAWAASGSVDEEQQVGRALDNLTLDAWVWGGGDYN